MRLLCPWIDILDGLEIAVGDHFTRSDYDAVVFRAFWETAHLTLFPQDQRDLIELRVVIALPDRLSAVVEPKERECMFVVSMSAHLHDRVGIERSQIRDAKLAPAP
jgi:hypothetical protein